MKQNEPGKNTSNPALLDLDEICAVLINVHQTVLKALIKTHPHPERFAQTLEQLIGHGQIEWLQKGVVHDVVKRLALTNYQEMIDTAKAEVENRKPE